MLNREPVPSRPGISRRPARTILLIVALVVIFGLSGAATLWTDYLWYGSMELSSVWEINLVTSVALAMFVLMHKGRGGGLSDLFGGGISSSMGGSSVAERNLDRLLATFPNINIFGYTLLPGTEFYERREEYRIETLPVAGYGKAHGEYVVGCHTFARAEGEEGYFLITAHVILLSGYVLTHTARWLTLATDVPVGQIGRASCRERVFRAV
mgnify:CR=1 FL=1